MLMPGFLQRYNKTALSVAIAYTTSLAQYNSKLKLQYTTQNAVDKCGAEKISRAILVVARQAAGWQAAHADCLKAGSQLCAQLHDAATHLSA